MRIWAYAHTNAIQMKRENLSSMGISFICIFFRYWERMERHKLGMFNFPRWIWCIENWTVWSFVKPERVQQRESALASQSQRISQPGAISLDINWVNKLFLINISTSCVVMCTSWQYKMESGQSKRYHRETSFEKAKSEQRNHWGHPHWTEESERGYAFFEPISKS